jgi:hypothetical protein
MPRPSGVGPRWRALNPPAGRADYVRARAVAGAVARECAESGAKAVLFAGSWVRGDAHRGSDLDLWVLGNRRGSEVRWREPFMVCIARTTAAGERRKLGDPPRIGGAVPAWRMAVPLYDPDGLAAGIQAVARGFRWEAVAARCDRWVAESVVAWAEEAIKLVRALSERRLQTACVQRNLLADALGFVMAIHSRTFWDSENEFWERIGKVIGGRWQVAQRMALHSAGADPERSCAAALRLYAETARLTRRVLSAEQLSIVRHAGDVIGLTSV